MADGSQYWRLTTTAHGQPSLASIGEPPRGAVLLSRERRDEMWRLIALAEGEAHRATSTDLHIARTIDRALDQAPAVVLDVPLNADGTQTWLWRFREAAATLDRAARVGP